MSESAETSGFQPSYRKEPGDLQHQMDAVSKNAGVAIQSPVFTNGEIEYSAEKLDKLFPERYAAYVKGLRDLGAQEAIKLGKERTTMPRSELLQHRADILKLNILDNLQRRHEVMSTHTPDEIAESKELQDWQVEVYQAMLDYVDRRLYKNQKPEGYVQLPTGTGKTVLFSDFVVASGLKSLIVVPNKILLEQTHAELSHIARQRGVDLDIGKFYGDEKQKRLGEDVTIAVYNSFSNDAESEQSELQKAGFGLVILDEAHRGLSDPRKRALDGITDAVKIGFTATPKFSHEKQVSHLLGQEIYGMSVQEAVSKDLLAPPTSPRYIRTSVDLTGINTRVKGDIRDYDEAALASRVNVQDRNKAAVSYYKEAEDVTGKTAVAYCAGVQHAKDLAAEFLQQGVSASVISGETPVGERKKLLKAYKEGTIKVLCNADLLVEGFNEPKASVCMNLRPTKSWVVAEQRAGRILRKDRSDPEKYAIFVEFIDEDEQDSQKPVLVKDIYEGAFLPDYELESRLAGKSIGFSDKAEGEVVTMKGGVDIAFYSDYGDMQEFVSSAENTETDPDSPWVSSAEIHERYGLSPSEQLSLLVQTKVAYKMPSFKDGKMALSPKTAEYHISNYEEAFLLKLLPLFEELNERSLAETKHIISLPKFYAFFHAALADKKHKPGEIAQVKEFLQTMADKKRGQLEDLEGALAEIEQTQFMRKFREFQNRYKPIPDDIEYKKIKKYTEYLLNYAENPVQFGNSLPLAV